MRETQRAQVEVSKQRKERAFQIDAHNLQLPFSTDEEAAASKRMVIYAFSAQINLFTSFFVKQPLRNTVSILFPFMHYK